MLVAVLNFDAKYLGLSKERNHVTRFHRDPYTHSSPGLKTMLATVNPLKKRTRVNIQFFADVGIMVPETDIFCHFLLRVQLLKYFSLKPFDKI